MRRRPADNPEGHRGVHQEPVAEHQGRRAPEVEPVRIGLARIEHGNDERREENAPDGASCQARVKSREILRDQPECAPREQPQMKLRTQHRSECDKRKYRLRASGVRVTTPFRPTTTTCLRPLLIACQAPTRRVAARPPTARHRLSPVAATQTAVAGPNQKCRNRAGHFVPGADEFPPCRHAGEVQHPDDGRPCGFDLQASTGMKRRKSPPWHPPDRQQQRQ